jgi:two-component system, OmpR family, alkaline phosphatase synthesis response regulator PhoP
LVVAGDSEFSRELLDLLERGGFQVLSLEASEDALARAKARQPFVIFMEASQIESAAPGTPRVIEELKSNPYTHSIPLVVVAPGPMAEDTQLSAFRQGADDYLARPESSDLFQARVRSVTRRYLPPEDLADELTAENLILDLRSRKVMVGGSPVALTRKEFDLLNTLLRRRGIVVYTTHLYHTVWGYGDSAPVDSHTVKVHVSSLRSKLGPELGRKIVNLPGLGYRFDN